MQRVSDTLTTLKQQAALIQNEARSIVNSALLSFEQTLQQKLGAAPPISNDGSTVSAPVMNAMDCPSLTEIVTAQIAHLERLMIDQQATLRSHIERQTKWLLWTLKLPVMACILLCTMVIGATWAWLPTDMLNARTVTVPVGAGGRPFLVILNSEWTTCQLPDQSMHPCRPE